MYSLNWIASSFSTAASSRAPNSNSGPRDSRSRAPLWRSPAITSATHTRPKPTASATTRTATSRLHRTEMRIRPYPPHVPDDLLRRHRSAQVVADRVLGNARLGNVLRHKEELCRLHQRLVLSQ